MQLLVHSCTRLSRVLYEARNIWADLTRKNSSMKQNKAASGIISVYDQWVNQSNQEAALNTQCTLGSLQFHPLVLRHHIWDKRGMCWASIWQGVR